MNWPEFVLLHADWIFPGFFSILLLLTVRLLTGSIRPNRDPKPKSG
ncbi:hypothetical protein [Spirosoma harenae]